MTTVKYRDIALNFSPNPTTGDLSLVKEEEAIKQSIRILVLTNVYERAHDDIYKAGSIYSKLFELMTPMVENEIRDSITTVIEDYEPRADLLDVQVHRRPQENAVVIRIFFRANTSTEPISFDVFLKRTA